MTVYVSESNHIVSADSLYDLERSLPKLGQGVSRRVYDLGDGTVLKVGTGSDFAGTNLSEAEQWRKVEGTQWEEHFAEVLAVADDGSWLIMRAVERTFVNDRSAWSEWYREVGSELTHSLKVGDLHYGNVGVTVQGQIKVIDYAWSEGSMSMEWLIEEESSCNCSECKPATPCSCDDCDCEECKPEGCDCEALKGCNVEHCKPCEDKGFYVLAVQFAISVPVCESHKVKRACFSLRQRNWERENATFPQLGMFVRFLGNEVPARI